MQWWSTLSNAVQLNDFDEETYHELRTAFVLLLGQYQTALREDNERLIKEVIRLKSIIVEPMQTGLSSIKTNL